MNTRRSFILAAGAAALGGVVGCSGPRRASSMARGMPRCSDRIPEVRVRDQYGESHWSYSDLIADRPVLCSFFYCQCQGSCPLTSSVIAKLRLDLAERAPGLSCISFTLAPETDDMEALAAYAQTYGVQRDDGLPPWRFLTGTAEDLEALRIGFGLRDPDPYVDSIRTNHAALLTYGNDQLDRWGAMPAAVEYRQLRRGILRMVAPHMEERT